MHHSTDQLSNHAAWYRAFYIMPRHRICLTNRLITLPWCAGYDSPPSLFISNVNLPCFTGLYAARDKTGL